MKAPPRFYALADNAGELLAESDELSWSGFATREAIREFKATMESELPEGKPYRVVVYQATRRANRRHLGVTNGREG